MAYKWKSAESFQKAKTWVNDEFGNQTRGKKMTKAAQNKKLARVWKIAKRKDKLGHFG